MNSENATTGSRMNMQDGMARSALNNSKAEPVTPSKRRKLDGKRTEVAMPKDGYPAICIDGPMRGMQTRVKNPGANVLAPMPSDPHYYCAVYKVTHQITPLGEIACAFSHLLARKKK